MKPRSTRGRAVRIGVRVIFALAALSIAAETAMALPVHYFVVAENPSRLTTCYRCDSYILPLSDPNHVARARTIIAIGGYYPDAEILAKIVAGSDGINRDMLAPGEPLWSWHVTEVLGFWTVGIPEITDFPGHVESDVAGWIASHPAGEEGVGQIIFPRYTVIAEIPEPGSFALLATGCGLLACLRRRTATLR